MWIPSKDVYLSKQIWIVSRHPGAQAWLLEQGYIGTPIAHLDLKIIEPGQIVIGTLPIQMVVELTQKQIEYWHLSITVPECWRGIELTLEQMLTCQPKIQKITARLANDLEQGF